jgi:hypothetical protein
MDCPRAIIVIVIVIVEQRSRRRIQATKLADPI